MYQWLSSVVRAVVFKGSQLTICEITMVFLNKQDQSEYQPDSIIAPLQSKAVRHSLWLSF